MKTKLNKIELKIVVDQLSEVINLKEGYKVSGMFDDDNKLVGWIIVKVLEDGTILPQCNNKYDNIKQLIQAYR